MSTGAAYAHGPSAFGGGFRRFVELTMTLARTDFKLRYFGSALGYLWSLMRPLLFFGVLYVFFTKSFRLGKGVPHYGVYLLTAIVLWTYFAEVTTGLRSVPGRREAMLRKVRFPRMVIPLSVSLTAVFNLGMNFIAVFVFALANGVIPSSSWARDDPDPRSASSCWPPASAMLLSALYVRFRDVQPIWEVFAPDPVLRLADHVLAAYFNTLTHSRRHAPSPDAAHDHTPGTRCYRDVAAVLHRPRAAMDPTRSAAAHAGGRSSACCSRSRSPGVFGLGWWVFTREAPRVAENL